MGISRACILLNVWQGGSPRLLRSSEREGFHEAAWRLPQLEEGQQVQDEGCPHGEVHRPGFQDSFGREGRNLHRQEVPLGWHRVDPWEAASWHCCVHQDEEDYRHPP